MHGEGKHLCGLVRVFFQNIHFFQMHVSFAFVSVVLSTTVDPTTALTYRSQRRSDDLQYERKQLQAGCAQVDILSDVWR